MTIPPITPLPCCRPHLRQDRPPVHATAAGGTIGEFKEGAFIIAVANQMPVLPVAIHGTRRIWQPGRRAIHSGQVRVTVGRPLPTGHQAGHDAARLCDQARDAICSAHQDLTAAMSAKAIS
jgi:1-acyl-sn-glycerol-3-phosphate acyltransferase